MTQYDTKVGHLNIIFGRGMENWPAEGSKCLLSCLRVGEGCFASLLLLSLLLNVCNGQCA